MDEIVPVENIANRIYLICGVRVMLDRDLAELYQVETSQGVEASCKKEYQEISRRFYV